MLKIANFGAFTSNRLFWTVFNSEKICLRINGEEFCSNDQNQTGFEITDDTIKFTGLLDGVSSFEMIVDNENGGIQVSNIMVLYAGFYIFIFQIIERR